LSSSNPVLSAALADLIYASAHAGELALVDNSRIAQCVEVHE
jgi:hypothetical protein